MDEAKRQWMVQVAMNVDGPFYWYAVSCSIYWIEFQLCSTMNKVISFFLAFFSAFAVSLSRFSSCEWGDKMRYYHNDWFPFERHYCRNKSDRNEQVRWIMHTSNLKVDRVMTRVLHSRPKNKDAVWTASQSNQLLGVCCTFNFSLPLIEIEEKIG